MVADAGAARDEALRDAMRRAVEQAVGATVSGRTLMVDLQVVEDRVAARAAGYVKSYEILDEKLEGDLYTVTIEALVSSELIENDLESMGALLRLSLGNPRILVLATDGSGRPEHAGVERRLLDHFVSKEFLTYTSSTALSPRDDGTQFSSRSLLEIADAAQVDIVVVAAVSMANLGTSSVAGVEVTAASATVNLQAVLARTGQVLASRSGAVTAGSTHVALARDNAIEAAVQELLPPFTQDMIRVLNDSVAGDGGSRSIQVRVTGVTDFLLALELRDAIGGVRGVASLQQREFDGRTATYDIQGSATTQDLAIRLIALDGLNVTITFLDAQTLEATLEGP